MKWFSIHDTCITFNFTWQIEVGTQACICKRRVLTNNKGRNLNKCLFRWTTLNSTLLGWVNKEAANEQQLFFPSHSIRAIKTSRIFIFFSKRKPQETLMYVFPKCYIFCKNKKIYYFYHAILSWQTSSSTSAAATASTARAPALSWSTAWRKWQGINKLNSQVC